MHALQGDAGAHQALILRLLAALLSLALVACGRGAAGSATVVSGSSVAHSPEAQEVIDAAVADAAAQLGQPAAQLRVERIEQREWGDSSLGCPQPGMMYAQLITPGYLVIVAGPGKRLEYHTDTRGRAVMCREL